MFSRWLRACRSTSGSVSLRCSSRIALDSVDFPTLRARCDPLVDKTSDIADLLATTMEKRRNIFFTRPRKFGKSLLLSIAAEMLAAGHLPPGVNPWPGYKRVDVDELFGGLKVHERLRKIGGDPTLGSLFQRPHFVIKLSLGETQTGTKLEASIIHEIADIAGHAFGSNLQRMVLERNSPSSALRALIGAVPYYVPVALLVDEYDAAIIQDVSKRRWDAANAGLEALHSLTMAKKSHHYAFRIERFIVTGVARFASYSLFSGANNFSDLTGDPLLSKILGFSETEILDFFPNELKCLGEAQGIDKDSPECEQKAMKVLKEWYNGYCFDGASTCFNPHAVLASLKAGRVALKELEGASSYRLLGVAPEVILKDLRVTDMDASAVNIDIADLEAEKVDPASLLLQTGLLTLDPEQQKSVEIGGVVKGGARLSLIPPNEFARQTFLRVVATMTALSHKETSMYSKLIADALFARNYINFQDILQQALSSMSSRTTKDKMLGKADKDKPPPREAPYHAFLHGLLLGALPSQLGGVYTELASAQGDADLVVMLKGRGLGQPSAAWILELGLGNSEKNLQAKLEQGKLYAAQFASLDVAVCAVLVDKKGGRFCFKWAKRPARANSPWESLDTPLLPPAAPPCPP